ncbi:hypothetical protein JY554_02635 [Serratia marcescens]|nr:hypothetical protein [Serratia marcescens]
MDNKLSELSNPAWIVGQQEIADFMRGDEALLVRGYDPESTEPALRMYSQEYVSALQHESAVNWEAAASLNVENQELKKRITELEQAMRHIHGAALDITVPRVGIAKAAELAVEHAAMKEQSNG